jgi:hypothetical protein
MISLVMLLVMTTMGVGLYISTKQTVKQVNISSNRTESLYSAETCVVEMINWFKKQKDQDMVPCSTVGVGNVCNSIADRKMNKWDLLNEKDSHREKMRKQGYRCEISLLKIESAMGKGVGGQLGQQSKNKKYTYKINSKGSVNSSLDEVEVLISNIF